MPDTSAGVRPKAQDSTQVKGEPRGLARWGLYQKAERLYHKVLRDSAPPGSTQFMAYPTVAFSPETSWEFGVSSVFVFTAKNDFKRNRLSEITAFAFFTLNRQYGLWSDHAIYTDLDKWYFLGRYRIQEFPLKYFGVGPNSTYKGNFVVDAKYLLLRQRILRKIAPNLFFGPEVDYQRLWDAKLDRPRDESGNVIGEADLPNPPGYRGSSNLGLGGALVYDNRHNYLNVRKGYFGELSLLRYGRSLSSDYDFTLVTTDLRAYHKGIHKNQVAAYQVYGQFVTDGSTPFNIMPMMGGEMLMRGYYTGRYRDKNYVATQAEYRFLPLPFSRRFGAAVFAGAGVVGPRLNTLTPDNAVWSAGGGLRYLLLTKKDIFIRLDAGFTREGHGFYIFLGEAF